MSENYNKMPVEQKGDRERCMPIRRFYHRNPRLSVIIALMLVSIIALAIALPIGLTRKNRHRHKGYQTLSYEEGACACGYYIPETSIAVTSRKELDPSTFDGSGMDDFLASQGFKVDERQLSTKPVKVNYTSANVDLSEKFLSLKVSGGPGDATEVNCGKIRTNNSDIQFGSFRFTTEASDVAGVCHGMFWYRDDYSEIDIEILTRFLGLNGETEGPGDDPPGLRMTIQPLKRGEDTVTSIEPFADLGVQPTEEFVEYRFDWSRNHIEWFANKRSLAVVDDPSKIPTGNGTINVNNWSRGGPKWTGDVPDEDSTFRVQRIVLYYNSTDADFNSAHKATCAEALDKRLCYVDE